MGKDRMVHVELPFNMTTDMLMVDPAVSSTRPGQTMGYELARIAQEYTSEEARHVLIAAVCLYTHLNGGVGNIGMYGEVTNFADCLATARIWMSG